MDRNDELDAEERKIAQTIERAVMRERERCAKIAASYFHDLGWDAGYTHAGNGIAKKIRGEDQLVTASQEGKMTGG